MNSFTSKFEVDNQTDRPRVVWIEPVGNDYTLLPGERLELVAHDPSMLPWFSVVERFSATQVYIVTPNPMHTIFVVLQAGGELIVGHNRNAAIAAGIEM